MRFLLGDWVDVPDDIASCPECGGKLTVCSNANHVESGKPIADALCIDCENEDEDWDEDEDRECPHRHRQSDWQPVVDKIRQWAGATAG